MEITKPQVHLRKKYTAASQSTEYFIHVVTFMNSTKYTPDGNEALPLTPSGGKFTVTLNLQEDPTIPEMTLLTPVVHTLSVGTIDLDTTPLLEIKVVNTSDSNSIVGEKIMHRDDADEPAMPISINKKH